MQHPIPLSKRLKRIEGKARQLQRKLYHKARREREFRFSIWSKDCTKQPDKPGLYSIVSALGFSIPTRLYRQSSLSNVCKISYLPATKRAVQHANAGESHAHNLHQLQS